MEIIYSNENNGETYLKLKVGSQTWTLRGFSRAGLKTSILVNELNVVFDMGYSNDRAFSFDNKLISHGHNDHIGGLYSDHCARKFQKILKERLIIMPKQCIKPFKMIATAVSEMNCGKSGEIKQIFDSLQNTQLIEAEACINSYHNLIGSTKPESEYVVKSYEMDHKIKSFGYMILRKNKKLKKEFYNLSPKEIMEKKKEIGEQNLTELNLTPLVAYSGDTTILGILKNPDFLKVPLLIMECTGFCPEDKTECTCGKHIHWDDLIEHQNQFQNEKIILFHFSQAYRKLEDIKQYENKVSDGFLNKIIYFF